MPDRTSAEAQQESGRSRLTSCSLTSKRGASGTTPEGGSDPTPQLVLSTAAHLQACYSAVNLLRAIHVLCEPCEARPSSTISRDALTVIDDVASLSKIEEGGLPHLPAKWGSFQMRDVLKALVEIVTDNVEDAPSLQRGHNGPKDDALLSPPLSVGALVVLLTCEKPAILGELCRRRMPRRCLPTPAAPSLAVADDGETLEAAGAKGITFLAQCAAQVTLRRPCGMKRWRDDAEEVMDPLNAGGSDFPFHTTNALSMLRSSYDTNGADATALPYWCSTGVTDLDRALGGSGFRSGWLTELYGEAGAGKTQIALQCLLQQAANDLAAAAVADALASNAALTLLVQNAVESKLRCPARTCVEVFAQGRVDARRCALVYLVAEDVPTARLGPLAAAAIRRATRSIERHALITSLPSSMMEAVICSAERRCTVSVVLSRLQIRRISSAGEVLRLLEAPRDLWTSPVEYETSEMRGAARRGATLMDAVRVSAGSSRRAVVVLDSIAATVVAGQWSIQGEAQSDVTVAALGAQLRQVAASFNWCVVVTNQVREVPTAARDRQAAMIPMKRTRRPQAAFSCASGWAGGSLVPALGFAWALAPHCRVQLRKSTSHGVRQMVLRHSPSYPPAQACFLITKDGIEEAHTS